MPAIFLTVAILGIIVVAMGVLGAYLGATESPMIIMGSFATIIGFLGYIGYYIHKWIEVLHV